MNNAKGVSNHSKYHSNFFWRVCNLDIMLLARSRECFSSGLTGVVSIYLRCILLLSGVGGF
jgi:hypothetical protein